MLNIVMFNPEKCWSIRALSLDLSLSPWRRSWIIYCMSSEKSHAITRAFQAGIIHTFPGAWQPSAPQAWPEPKLKIFTFKLSNSSLWLLYTLQYCNCFHEFLNCIFVFFLSVCSPCFVSSDSTVITVSMKFVLCLYMLCRLTWRRVTCTEVAN